MTDKELVELELMVCKVRKGILDATHAAKSGHPGGSLSAAEIFSYLYFREMKVDPKNPKMADRDRFVLSKGHTAPGLYAALAHRGFFPVEDLLSLRRIGSYLQGHPSLGFTPGVDMSTGSLGQGVSAACGMALGFKHQGTAQRVYTLLGDGELNEGECWEAFMFAAHYGLDNLCVIVDINGLQSDGRTADVMNTGPLDKKFEAFGFEVIEVDGNNLRSLDGAFGMARKVRYKPTVILAYTTKGQGVCFMENVAGWHGVAPNDEQHRAALGEVEARYEELREGEKNG